MPDPTPVPFRLPAGADRSGATHPLGPVHIDFKVMSTDSRDLLAVEMTASRPGGPERHFHHAQEEWFYVLAGEFLFEINGEHTTHIAGDTLFVPRRTPHGWAATSPAGGRLLIVFTPAGPMEGFFNHMAAQGAMAGPDPALWATFGMEWLGPPLLAK